MIEVTKHLTIPEQELAFTAARSGGPGGQHVNKVSSRVTLYFDVTASPSLTDEQKRRILRRLATRISKDGVLRVVSQQSRSQAANRETAVARFVTLLQEALTPVPVRKKTTLSTVAKQQRLEDKKRRSQQKQQRAERPTWEE